MLAALPREQVRALYPDAAAFADRTGARSAHPRELRDVLERCARDGFATEDGEVTLGLRVGRRRRARPRRLAGRRDRDHLPERGRSATRSARAHRRARRTATELAAASGVRRLVAVRRDARRRHLADVAPAETLARCEQGPCASVAIGGGSPAASLGGVGRRSPRVSVARKKSATRARMASSRMPIEW